MPRVVLSAVWPLLLALCACEATSPPTEPKVPGATETNVHRGVCGDPDGDAAALRPDGHCEEDAGDPHEPCKVDGDCEDDEQCSHAGFCF
jgi:hypothetical protein